MISCGKCGGGIIKTRSVLIMSSLLMILGNLLALFAIFSMFGEAISGFELTMFDFAFGVKINEQDIIPQSMGVYSTFL